MGLSGIWAIMLNNRAKKDASRVLESLQIKTGDVIADVGSGGGHFTLEFAKKVGKDGRVFAVDTNRKLLDYIDAKLQTQQIRNVVTVIGGEKGFALPNSSCDLMFMRNVFHHISDPVPYFQNIRVNLNPEGRIAIIEWRPGAKGSYAIHTGHCTPEPEICKVMEAAGFRHLGAFGFLEKQSFNIFGSGIHLNAPGPYEI
jgi:arsenite methyltransferase